MMRRLLVSLYFLSFHLNFSYCQDAFQKWDPWQSPAQVHPIPADHGEDHALIILDNRRIEYRVDSKNDTHEYASFHKIIHIKDEKGIESFKKTALDFRDFESLVNFQARIINPGGKEIPIKLNLRDSQNHHADSGIFVLEGLEKGSEIEFLYTYKRKVDYFGREIVQTQYPVLNFTFEIISPPSRIFIQKPYNFQIQSSDSLIQNKRFLRTHISDIPAFLPELFSSNSLNAYRIEYKWASRINESGQSEKIFTWNDLARKLYTSFTPAPNNVKLLKLIEERGWNKLSNDSIKIISIENFIKSKIQFDPNLNDSIQNTLDPILDKGISGKDGILRLMGAIFQNLGLDFQFVLVGDRHHFVIDPDFSNWINGQNYLIFFPSTNKYLAPTEWGLRYPWFPASWGDSQALFCNDSKKGGLATLFAEIGAVELEGAHKCYSNVDVKLEFNRTLDSVNVDNKFLFGGYPANDYRNLINNSSKQGKDKLIKSLTHRIRSTENVPFFEIINGSYEDENSNLPFIVHTKTKSRDIIKNSGGRISIKMGMLLNLPKEVPTETNRKWVVVQDYGRIIQNKIQIKIPKGYTLKNGIELMKGQNLKENDEITLGFSSGYEQKGDILYIHSEEDFTKPSYAADHYPIFQAIMNTSRDFKNIVLVLERKLN